MTGKMFSVVMPMLPFCTAIVLLSFFVLCHKPCNNCANRHLLPLCRVLSLLTAGVCAEACPPIIIYARNARVGEGLLYTRVTRAWEKVFVSFASQGGAGRAKCREKSGEVAAKSSLLFAKSPPLWAESWLVFGE